MAEWQDDAYDSHEQWALEHYPEVVEIDAATVRDVQRTVLVVVDHHVEPTPKGVRGPFQCSCGAIKGRIDVVAEHQAQTVIDRLVTDGYLSQAAGQVAPSLWWKFLADETTWHDFVTVCEGIAN